LILSRWASKLVSAAMRRFRQRAREGGRSTIAEYFLTWESISPKSRPATARSEIKWFYSTL